MNRGKSDQAKTGPAGPAPMPMYVLTDSRGQLRSFQLACKLALNTWAVAYKQY